MKTVNNRLVLIRGLPGSGKSTYAEAMQGYLHFEADMFFEVDGQYCYDASKIPAAHAWCMTSVKTALAQGENVVVANTFVQRWEMHPYTQLGYPFRVIEMTGDWPNVHGVPAEKVREMQKKWEKAPADWHVVSL